MAEDESTEGTQISYQYLKLEPDIVTNYVKSGKKIGFVRVTVDLMVDSAANFAILERHEPLIRDKIITIFGQQTEDMVKKPDEREGILQRCLEEINELLFVETNRKPLRDLFFTKYLYQ